jgi:hypothetical protein
MTDREKGERGWEKVEEGEKIMRYHTKLYFKTNPS